MKWPVQENLQQSFKIDHLQTVVDDTNATIIIYVVQKIKHHITALLKEYSGFITSWTRWINYHRKLFYFS